jgi:hypothetical protein
LAASTFTTLAAMIPAEYNRAEAVKAIRDFLVPMVLSHDSTGFLPGQELAPQIFPPHLS